MNKKIISIILLIFLLIIPLIVLGNRNKIRVNYKGVPIISSIAEKNNLEDGTKYILEVPTNTAVIISDEERIGEKQQILENTVNSNIDKIKKSVSSNELINENNKKQFEKNEKIQEEFKSIFIKYYGQETLENILNVSQNEMKQDTELLKKYVFPNSGEEFIRKSIDIIYNENSTENERKIIIFVLNQIDLLTLENEELRQELINLGIELE